MDPRDVADIVITFGEFAVGLQALGLSVYDMVCAGFDRHWWLSTTFRQPTYAERVATEQCQKLAEHNLIFLPYELIEAQKAHGFWQGDTGRLIRVTSGAFSLAVLVAIVLLLSKAAPIYVILAAVLTMGFAYSYLNTRIRKEPAERLANALHCLKTQASAVEMCFGLRGLSDAIQQQRA